MQSFSPVVANDFLTPVQSMRYRLEIWDGSAWQDLCSLGAGEYVKSVSVSLGGAGPTAEPIAGSWSAVIDNKDGMFHPFHPTSPYADLLRVGREVRISFGGQYNGISYYWRRLIGFMDAPRFVHRSKEVEISGLDYSKLLTDFNLREGYDITESGVGSGSFGADDIINGPLHWGRRAIFDSVASPGGTGGELYAEADACDIADEHDTIVSWSVGGSGGIVDSVAPGHASSYCLQLERDAPGPTSQYAHDANVATGVAGNSYTVGFWGRILSGGHYGKLIIYQTIGGVATKIGESVFSDSSWVYHSIVVNVTVAGAIQARVESLGKYAESGDKLQVDEITIRLYDPTTWMRYELPEECNGPYFVTLDGEPVGQGYQGDEVGWYYEELPHHLFFTEGMTVNVGTDNIYVYYYTDQVPENVVADILKWAGYYPDRASALADMDYEPTGVIFERVWFDSGDSGMEAIRLICERLNYRFWFTFDGQPCFKPAPVADVIDFSFTNVKELTNLIDYQDLDNIQNHIVIEGCQQAMYQVTRDDKSNDCFQDELSDPTSIGLYLEKTNSVKNHLFQDKATITAMCATLLAERKDPKWYSEVQISFCPVPLELGDVIEWPIELEPQPNESGSGAVIVTLMGIIRDIKLNDGEATYVCEVVDSLYSGSSASASASASPSASPSGTETYEYFTADQDWSPPSGFDGEIVVECWAAGGKGANSPDYIKGGGGGGGGAYSKKTLNAVHADSFHIDIGDANNRTKANRDTKFKSNSTGLALCLAAGGEDASGELGAPGGHALDGIGDVKYSGGYGADQNEDGGGGGGAAGSSGNGENGTVPLGGAYKFENGGPGGDGGELGGDGNSPANPYGGGGGGASSGKKSGAIGWNGYCKITYYV